MPTPDEDGKAFVGRGAGGDQFLALANRRGLVTGAICTGKTASLQCLAKGFSQAGCSSSGLNRYSGTGGAGIRRCPDRQAVVRGALTGVMRR